MQTDVLALFLLTVAVGSYVQTVSGFALGLIVMGAVTLFNLAPVAFTAVVISIISLVNTGLTLHRNHDAIDWHTGALVTVGMLPAIVLGVMLLQMLDASATGTVRALLGGFILIGGVLLMLRPQPYLRRSPGILSVAAGAVGGLFGGLFSTAGPPLVYYMYRQPMTLHAIRATLLASFAVATVVRLGYVGFEGGISADMLWISLWSIPVVFVATLLGKRFAPPLSDLNMRRFAFGLLILLGTSLLVG